MKKVLLTVLFIFIMTQVQAQVGIGTTNPKATIDIVASYPTGTSVEVDGIIIPRVDRQRAQSMTSIDVSTIIYVNNETTGSASGIASNITKKGFYYYDGLKWASFNMSTSSVLDIGYIVGWSASTNPPDYLLPVSGGTFNWSDYPDLQLLNTTHPIQFIQSSTATTFTLKDINTNGKFLRGSSIAGTNQTQATALPATSFTTNSTGDHTHTVDPVAVNTTNNGSHTHSTTVSYQRDGVDDNNYSTDVQKGDNGTILSQTWATSSAGDHNHSVDIPSTISSITGNHLHTVTGGGDVETRPTNISVIWCLKAKPTNTSGNITINNGNITSLTTVGTSGASILSGSTLNIPQYNSSNYGDIKTGIQTADHNGWIKLNGRLKSTLTATQQTQATSLGIGANLPDASNAFFVQNGAVLGSVSGSNTTTIGQNQLPNIGISIPGHSHVGYDRYINNANIVNGNDTDGQIGMPLNGWSQRMKTNEAGVEGLQFESLERTFFTSSVSMSTNSINGNVPQVQFDKTPRSFSVNTFIYLGN